MNKSPCDSPGSDPGAQDITVPLGLVVGPWETRKQVINQGTPSTTPVAGKITLWVDSVAGSGRVQSIVGAARQCARAAKSEITRKGIAGNFTVYGHWDSAGAGVTIENVSPPTNVQPGDLGFSVSGTFPTSTMAFDNAVNMLIDRMIEIGKT